MARRLKSRNRKYAGNRTFGGGNTKNRRGKGNRGGVGRAGVGKHRRLFFIKTEGSTLRDRGLQGFTNPTSKKTSEITLEKLQHLIDKGKFQQKEGAFEVNLPKTKVLSNGVLTAKASVKAQAFSSKAMEKIKQAGGSTATY